MQPFHYCQPNYKTSFKECTISEALVEINALETDSILFISDGKVWERFSKYFDFKEHLPNKKIHLWKTPEGEKAKQFTEYVSCAEFFLEKGIHRRSYVIALGGGAASDFAGFVASTLLRGLAWSIIPTTLLSMVDASIGGKVAINSKSGKNLIGAFHLPDKIWADLDFLKTLPPLELRSGKGEIIKYAFLDKNIYDTVMSSNGDYYEIVPKCAQYKLDLTERDFKETGERKVLNLGHSFGHGLEKIYNLPHGEAVMWGIALILFLFEKRDLIYTLQQLKLTLQWPDQDPPWLHKTFPTKEIMSYISKDKKMTTNSCIDLVIPDDVGKVKIHNIELSMLEEKLNQAENELRKFKL